MTLFAELTGGSFILVAVVAVMACLLMIRTQRQLRQTTKNAKPPPAAACPPRAEQRMRSSAMKETKIQRETEHWEVRMHDLARELSAQLDSKMSALEHLICDADRQITRIDERLAKLDERLSRRAEATREVPAETERSPLFNAPHISTQAAALATNQPQRQAIPRAPKERRYDEVYALADAGHSPAAIAGRVGSPVGEIELILSLRKRG